MALLGAFYLAALAIGAALAAGVGSGGSGVGGFPASPTFRGDVTIKKATPVLFLNADTGTEPKMRWLLNGVQKWLLISGGPDPDFRLYRGAIGSEVQVLDVDQSTGNATFSASLLSTKACAAGYTRKTPNLCLKDVELTVTWTDAAGCTARTLGGTLPADATAVLLNVRWRALSNNAVGIRQNDVFFWKEAACTNPGSLSYFGLREQAATAAGTDLGGATLTHLVPLVATDTIRTTQTNAGGNGNAEVTVSAVIGYHD